MAGDRETSSRNFQPVADNQGVDIVEVSASSETEEEPTSNVSVKWAGNAGAPPTRDNFAPTVGKEKLWMRLMHRDGLEPHKGVARDEIP
jgi:hypothetical protein